MSDTATKRLRVRTMQRVKATMTLERATERWEDAIVAARDGGMSWREIGDACDMTGMAMIQHYRRRVQRLGAKQREEAS